MARPQVFNQQKVLAKAIECFWIKGYSETSLADLVRAMSISRSTFYNNFGDKRQLFELCLNAYGQQIQAISAVTLSNQKLTPLKAIKQFFYLIFITPNEQLSSRGCLLVNTIAEASVVNDELKNVAIKLMQPVRRGLIAQLERDLDEEMSNQLGEWLFTQLLGWRLQCQFGLSKECLEQQINLSLLKVQQQLDDV